MVRLGKDGKFGGLQATVALVVLGAAAYWVPPLSGVDPSALTRAAALVAGLAGVVLGLTWGIHRSRPLCNLCTLLLAGIAGCVWGAAEFLGPPAAEAARPPAPLKRLTIIVDVSDVVLFPDEDGDRAGPQAVNVNALAATVDAVCRRIEARLAGEAPARPGFLTWLRNEGPILVNWRPAPVPDRPSAWPTTCELFLMDGRGCWPAGPGERPSAAFRSALARGALDASRPTGLPAAGVLQALGLPAGDDTAVLFLTAADVNSAREREIWRTQFHPGTARVMSLLLPSFPRSGNLDLRGAAAKADVLRIPGGPVVVLTDTGPDGPRKPLYDGLPNLNGDPAYWDYPRDLDQLRREWFGPARAAAVRQAVDDGALDDHLETLVSGSARPSAWGADRPAIAKVAAAVAGVTLVWLCFVYRRTLELDKNVLRPGLGVRGLCLAGGLTGLVLMAIAVYIFWPGTLWQQTGRPALAVWTFVAVWAALVVFPIADRLDVPRLQSGLLLGMGLGIPLVAGLVWPGFWAGVAATALVLVPIPMFRRAGRDAGSGSGGPWSKPPSAWAGALGWCPTATIVAAWCAFLMIGHAPARDSGPEYLGRLAVLGLAAAGVLVVVFGLGWLADRRDRVVTDTPWRFVK
jgi:hypothetical protein